MPLSPPCSRSRTHTLSPPCSRSRTHTLSPPCSRSLTHTLSPALSLFCTPLGASVHPPSRWTATRAEATELGLPALYRAGTQAQARAFRRLSYWQNIKSRESILRYRLDSNSHSREFKPRRHPPHNLQAQRPIESIEWARPLLAGVVMSPPRCSGHVPSPLQWSCPPE